MAPGGSGHARHAVKPHCAHRGERAAGRGHPAARQLPTLTSAPSPAGSRRARGAHQHGGGGGVGTAGLPWLT